MSNDANPIASGGNSAVNPANADAELLAVQSKTSMPPSGTLNASSTVPNNVAGLRKEAPEVYKAMLEGIAQSVLSKLRKHQKEMKKLIRKSLRGES